MPTVKFLTADGIEHAVDAPIGANLMKVAVENAVPGIIGDCGGNCSCATCHGYIDDAWRNKLPPIGETESMMLEGALFLQENSRLTCQITLTDDLDGLVVCLPEEQS